MQLDTFTRAYIEAALWSSNDFEGENGGEPLDKNYDLSDIHPEVLRAMEIDCANFQRDNAKDLALSQIDESKAGHCFWLNRNGHGSGFWDEYGATSCALYNDEQKLAMISGTFAARNRLKESCNCPYHACARLSDASKPYGSFDLYVGDDGMIHGS